MTMETELSSLTVEEIFKLLESNNTEVVAEIERFFHENLSELKEPWLVSRLISAVQHDTLTID